METTLDHEIACLIDLIRHQYFRINGVSYTVDCYGNDQLRACNDGSLQAVLFAQQLLQRCNSAIESTILVLNQTLVPNGCTGIETYVWRVAMPSSLTGCCMTAGNIMYYANMTNQRLNAANTDVASLKRKERELQNRNEKLEKQLKAYQEKETLRYKHILKLRLSPYRCSSAKREERQYLSQSDTEENISSTCMLRLQNMELQWEIKYKDMLIDLLMGLTEVSSQSISDTISRHRADVQRLEHDKQMDQLVHGLSDRIEYLSKEDSNVHLIIQEKDGQILELSTTLSEIQERNRDLQNKISDLEVRAEELEGVKQRDNTASAKLECKIQECNSLNLTIRGKDKKILELSQTLEEVQERNVVLQNKIQNLSVKQETEAKTLEKVKKEKISALSSCAEFEKILSECKLDIQLKDGELGVLKQGKEKLFTRNQELENEIEKGSTDLCLKDEELRNMKQNVEKLLASKKELEKEVRSCNNILQLKAEELRKMKQNNEKLFTRIDVLQKKIRCLGDSLQIKDEQLEKATQEKEELLTRLSQYTSAQLIQDNPNVADLSDINRPTKLVEKFSELYDNEWTDGFEVLSDTFKFTERQAIQRLLDILLAAYRYCLDTSGKQDKMLKNALMCPGYIEKTGGLPTVLDSVQLRTIDDLRKQTSHNSVKSVQKGFLEDLTTSALNSPDVTSYQKYISQCVELCWHMVIRSPPLILDGPVSKGDVFDKNRYKFYQTAGPHYDYVVWPPLRLDENGPLLSKGTAEGLKRNA